MNKRVIIVGSGAITATLIGARAGQKLRARVSEMAAHCKEMMAGRSAGCDAPRDRRA